jgi:hypothetical protein
MLLLNFMKVGPIFLQQPISNSGVWGNNELDWRHLKFCILKGTELISRKQVVDHLRTQYLVATEMVSPPPFMFNASVILSLALLTFSIAGCW